MEKTYYLVVLMFLVLGCKQSDNPQYNGVPSSVYVAVENTEYAVLLNDEVITDSIEGLPTIKQVSLWTYEKSKKEGKRILMTHPNADGSWFNMNHSVSITLDSIPTIQKVKILSWENEPLKLLVEGCIDYRNVESYIIDVGKDSAICLPTNRGLIGISEENGLLIMQSYAYYQDGGRYNIIEAFDMVGNRISSMKATP